jgi:phosphate transport system substrate-binding protein
MNSTTRNKKVSSLLFSLIIGLGSVCSTLAETRLIGAGATFPYPIYSKWFDEYNKIHPDVKINYQSIGSGGGVKQFTAKTVDFGATDGPMSDKELFQVDGKSLHIPTVLGSVIPTWNLPGIQELNFTGDVLANIFLGKIKYWDDASIKAINPGVTLPSTLITVIRRADGSGTTYCWTDYLTKVSPEWKKSVGVGKSVNWPVGLGGKGNEGVAGLVKQTTGALGYVELIYAKQNNMPSGAVKNAAGKFVKASIESVSAAAAGVKMPADFRVSIVNAAGENSYPISTFTWILVYEKNSGSTGKTIKDFLGWMLTDGQPMASTLGYAPLPPSVNEMVKKTIQTIH